MNYLNNKRMKFDELSVNNLTHNGNCTREKHQLMNPFHF